ncbi:hypothetical protein HBA93_18925 [Ochrobactrum sp. SFR4]|nr:hypothetical protein [Ochrobactrum sp. MR28]MBX8818987.1 hypothetical protein [Ochrobactrum sp. MR31]MBX8827681.1 hypothetical protein [Ochrobactrum sp. SFR4]
MSKEPAFTLIAYLGGAKAVSSIVGKHYSRIYRWTYGTEKREGTGGLVPAKDQKLLMEWAERNNFDLQPVDFFSSDRIKALLEERAKLQEAV